MFVSVIMPSYNSAEFILNSINSILAQTYQDFEIIIIDDGSKDNTRKIIESLNNPKIVYIYQDNAGPGAARNTGLAVAKGELIAFLDADDSWKPQKLEIQVKKFIENSKLGLVYSALDVLSEDGHFEYTRKYKNYKSHELIKQLLLNYCKSVPLPSTVILKKSYLDMAGYFDTLLPTGEDRDLWFRIAAISDVEYIDNPMTIRFSPKTSIQASMDNSLSEECQIKIQNNFFSKNPLRKSYLKYKSESFSYIYFTLSRAYFNENIKNPPFNEILRCFFISFKSHPLSYFIVPEKAKYLVRLLLKSLFRNFVIIKKFIKNTIC